VVVSHVIGWLTSRVSGTRPLRCSTSVHHRIVTRDGWYWPPCPMGRRHAEDLVLKGCSSGGQGQVGPRRSEPLDRWVAEHARAVDCAALGSESEVDRFSSSDVPFPG
jgi:hypothetical protein